MKRKTARLISAAMIMTFLLTACESKPAEGTTEAEPETESEEADTPEPEVEEQVEVTVAEPEQEESEEYANVQEAEFDVEAEDGSTEVRFGTNQADAVLVPLNTRIHGTIEEDEYCWCSFTTGSDKDSEYWITVVDKTSDSYQVYTILYDDYGEELAYTVGGSDGTAQSMSYEDLEPDTTYYIRLDESSHAKADFMLIVRDINETASGIQTSDSFADVSEGEIPVETNQDDAAKVAIGSQIEATLDDGAYHYYAFIPTVSGEYTATVIDKTATSYQVYTILYDDFGNQLAYAVGGSDGTAATLRSEELTAGETYCIRLDESSHSEAEYSLVIRGTEDVEKQTATVTEEDLIFTEPFEINSTKVQFVINQAIFIDENAAREAVAPVADALLSHPDHSVLLVGTTATDGTQESCVDLSNRRAAAVKDLLVNEFGVPESQMQTIGLGYEKDPFERGQDRVVPGDITSKFVESEGKKNRRVIILDIEDPTAQEILASN